MINYTIFKNLPMGKSTARASELHPCLGQNESKSWFGLQKNTLQFHQLLNEKGGGLHFLSASNKAMIKDIVADKSSVWRQISPKETMFRRVWSYDMETM